jgi:hypothetical protein
MEVTKGNFIDTLKAKLKAGDIIGTVAFDRVSKIISGLREQLATAQSGSIKAVAASTTAAKAAEEKTRAAEIRIQDAEKKAETAETAVVQALRQIDEGKQITRDELKRLTDTMALMSKAGAKETDELNVLIVDLKNNYKKLTQEKDIAEANYRQLFVQALTELDDALGGLSVNTLEQVNTIEQSGGFQSSSSGNYDYKKYRSSSRSYSKQIKDLNNKRKQSKKERKKSKKIRRDRKKRSKRNKTRKR